ncbi:adenosine deaminase [Amnibacterium kyonggiense]|uniref:Adenine deaminase n=1 Tax=Amnibacterium kyonggiense TaxID=595671 RepID=A0A4R7FQQ4_9MICO|nr:adenosine deaminase [Amnibacterium kyonggiense]TDS80121.1 adenosine deaminase [Amnibacterium kyonggiense]
MDLDAFVAGMPKTELHVHLEGTLERDLLLRLAARNGVDVPIPEGGFTDLTSFLAQYYPAMRALVTEDDFFELAWAYLEKAASQHVVHAELFFDPQAHTGRGVPFPTVLGGYRRAILRAERELGVHADLILCFLRDLTAEHAMSTLMEALPFKAWIVGVGLDSDERGNPPAKFADVFARARAEGFQLTMHCDIDQPGSIEHIRSALLDIGVDRIDHGTNVVEDPALVAVLRERGVGLTCCPISNGFVTDDMKAQEIAALLRSGVKVTVASDDPAYFGGYVTENLLALAAAADLTRDELVQLQRNALEIAWLAPFRRDALLAGLEAHALA